MKPWIALTLCVSVAGATPAIALSCLEPTVAGAYQAAANSPQDYVIGVGTLTRMGPSDPPDGATAQGGDPNNMIGYTQPARFEGSLFNGQNFDNHTTRLVTINVTCSIAWCGALPPQDYSLFFFRLESGAYVLDENACPGNSFPGAHPGMLQEVIDCHAGTCPGHW